MPFKLAVIINKDGSELSPSETFLHAHINQMPCDVVSLVGNPGFRMVRHRGQSGKHYLASRKFLPLAARWFSRKAFDQSVADQDTQALTRFLRNEGVNAVLAEYGPTAVSVMQACKNAGVPLIAQFHGYDAYSRPLLRELDGDYKTLFSLASGVVGVSKDMCSRLIEMGAVENRLFHNACGAEIDTLKPAAVDGADARFVMVGRLVEKKAPFVSLLAFSSVLESLPDAKLEIIGDGPLKGPCQQLTMALGVDNRVTFSGAKPHDYVMSALAGARCFIQHSVRAPDGDMEGTPVGVLEAMGMGLPVVATRHGGIQDIVDEGVTGLLVDEYDADAMGAAMRKVADDPDYASELGARARAAVLDNWTSEKSVARLWDIIQKSC
jgi:glycosyltransferase involved in cell wall biosynthesis